MAKNDTADLLHLIRLSFRAVSLQINLLFDPRFAKYMMATASSLNEAESK